MSFFRPTESKELQPFYSLRPGIKPEAFDHVDIDDKSLELLAKAPDGQRFAFVGWIDDDKINLRFRPSISPPPDAESKHESKQYQEALAKYEKTYKELQEHFGAENVVQAKRQQTGIVHEQVEQQVKNDENDTFKPSPLHPKIGGSFYSYVTDRGIEVVCLNRSAQNYATFKRDVLALARIAFKYGYSSDPTSRNFDWFYHLERSIPIDFFDRLMKAMKKNLDKNLKVVSVSGEDATKIYNIEEEEEWEKIIALEEKERNRKIQEGLMQQLFIFLMDRTTSRNRLEAEGILKRGFAKAKFYNIPIDFNHIPKLNLDEDLFKFSDTTALGIAALQYNSSHFELLFSLGAKPNDRIDKLGNTALITVTRYLDKENILEGKKIIELLLITYKADPNEKNSSGYTALDFALKNMEIMTLLLENKADPNTKTKNGITPLLEVVGERQLDAVKCLISYGADPLLAGGYGMTPLALAASKEYTDIVYALLKINFATENPERLNAIKTYIKDVSKCRVSRDINDKTTQFIYFDTFAQSFLKLEPSNEQEKLLFKMLKSAILVEYKNYTEGYQIDDCLLKLTNMINSILTHELDDIFQVESKTGHRENEYVRKIRDILTSQQMDTFKPQL